MGETTDVIEIPPAPQQSHQRRNLIIGAAAILVAAGVGIGVAVSGNSPGSFTVHGSIQLNALQYGDDANPLNPVDGDSCQGINADSAIAAGLTVRVEGSSGQTLASGLLQPGTMKDVGPVDGLQEGLCVMPFTITVPGGQSQYAVAITGHGAQEYSQAQLEKGVALSLGA